MDLLAWIAQQVLDLHRQIHQELSIALRILDSDGAAFFRAGGVAFVLGMVHALTPGHGKAILFSYFLGRRVHPWDGMVTAAQVAGMHIGTAATLVIAVGGAAYVLGRPVGVALALQGASALAVTVVGVWYLWRAIRGTSALEPTQHHSGVATAAGLLPCPLTMLVLGAAFAHAALAVGLVLVLVMGLGIMVTIGAIATSGIAIRRSITKGLEGRLKRYHRLLCGLELVSAGAILFIGLSSLFALIG